MARVKTSYLGDARVEITHTDTGAIVTTDASREDRKSFSPVELLLGSLGGCILGMMDMMCGRLNIDLSGARTVADYTMSEDPSKQMIGEIVIDVYLPEGEYDKRAKTSLERAALSCPVGNSLHPDVKKTINFHYGDEK